MDKVFEAVKCYLKSVFRSDENEQIEIVEEIIEIEDDEDEIA